MKKLVYISHPSSGLEENTKKIEDIISTLYSYKEVRDKYTFVSPVHNYGFMYHTVEYDLGLQFCTDLLEHCEEVWVFGNYTKSKGCAKEISLAKELGIKLRIFDADSIKETKQIIESGEYYRSKHKELESPTMNKVYSRTKMVYCAMKKVDNIREDTIKNYVISHLLYSDIATALNNYKEYDTDYFTNNDSDEVMLIEVELDTSKVFDMTSNYDIKLYNNYCKYKKFNYDHFVSSYDKIDTFMNDMKKSFNCIRRVKENKSHESYCIIPESITEAFSVYGFECIRRIKIFNSQTRDILESSFIIGDIS